MVDFKKASSKLVSLCLSISVAFVIVGEALYLLVQGHVSMNSLSLTTLDAKVADIFIQAGLFLLVVFQLLLVLIIGWSFSRLKDKFYVFISAFIFSVLVYSIFFTK